MSSFTCPFWSSSTELKKEEEKKQHVYCGKKVKKVKKKHVNRRLIIDDENEAESVWKSILQRKGLPLDTKYEYVDTLDKGYDESYCDMLHQTIEEKKKNPEAAKSWGRSTVEWLPPPASPAGILTPDYVYYGQIIDDEIEAESVWKSILKRKGLPLDTKYKYENTLYKGYDESYCDMLYLTIEEKKKNPEAAKSWGRTTFEWLPPPAPPTRILSRDYVFYDDLYFDDRERDRKITRNVNGIIYPKGSEASKKRFQLTVEMGKKKAENLKELQAKGLALPGLFCMPVSEEDSQYW